MSDAEEDCYAEDFVRDDSPPVVNHTAEWLRRGLDEVMSLPDYIEAMEAKPRTHPATA